MGLLEDILCGKRTIHLGMMGIGTIGTPMAQSFVEQAAQQINNLFHSYIDHITLVSSKPDLIEDIKSTIIRDCGGLPIPIDNPGLDYEKLHPCDILIYAKHWGDTPTEFEMFDEKRLRLITNLYIEFIENAAKDYHSEKSTLHLTPGYYNAILDCLAPILGKPRAGELHKEKNDAVTQDDFNKLRDETCRIWAKQLGGAKAKPLPANTFDALQGGFPDFVFEKYVDLCIDTPGLEFIVNPEIKDSRLSHEKNLEIKDQLQTSYEIYKVLRSIKGIGYRELRFYPIAHEHLLEDAEILNNIEKPLIFTVTNPVGSCCETLYRKMGKNSKNRIMGVCYPDSKRYSAEIYRAALQGIPEQVLIGATVDGNVQGSHNRNAVPDPNFEVKALGNQFQIIHDAVGVPLKPEEAARMQKLIASYTARTLLRNKMHGAPKGTSLHPYFEVVGDTIKLIERYVKGESVPSSVHTRLGKFEAYRKRNLLERDIGTNLSIPVRLVEEKLGNDKVMRIEEDYE
jgi:hypothetical protein